MICPFIGTRVPLFALALDDEFIPDVNLPNCNLSDTVILGEVLGNWEAQAN